MMSDISIHGVLNQTINYVELMDDLQASCRAFSKHDSEPLMGALEESFDGHFINVLKCICVQILIFANYDTILTSDWLPLSE